MIPNKMSMTMQVNTEPTIKSVGFSLIQIY